MRADPQGQGADAPTLQPGSLNLGALDEVRAIVREVVREVVREELRRCEIRPPVPDTYGARYKMWTWDAERDAWVEVARAG